MNRAMNDEIDADEACGAEFPEPRPGAVVRHIPIVNQKGLHARASAKFVQTVERFHANVFVTRCGQTVGGDSIMGLMMLAAAPGTTIMVEALGTDADAVIAALEELIGGRFGEDD
jgi:phosphocarrier protein